MDYITNVGSVSDIKITTDSLKKIYKDLPDNFNLDELVDIDNTIYYSKQGMVLPKSSSAKSSMKLVPLKDNNSSNKIIYLFFRKKWVSALKNTEDMWAGTFVGTLSNLQKHIHNEDFISQRMLSKIYELLWDKESWLLQGSEISYYRIQSYLNFELKFFNSYLDKKDNGLVFNQDCSKALINTRLFSKYASYIILIGDINSSGRFRNLSILDSSFKITSLGFKDEVRPNPPDIFKNANDFVFNAKFEDFSLEDYDKIKHIIVDRPFRFRNLSVNMNHLDLFLCIQNSIKIASELSKTDINYALPMYSPEFNEIQYLIPVNINFSDLNHPQCALVVRKARKDVWTLQTILDIESAYMSARIIKKPDALWLTLKE